MLVVMHEVLFHRISFFFAIVQEKNTQTNKYDDNYNKTTTTTDKIA